jgi:hypothetical protein
MAALLTLAGTAVGGLIGWSGDPVPSADPVSLRALFADLGMRVGPADDDLTAAVRRFQAHAGLATDGVAGPQTVHRLARYAREARDLRRLHVTAA